jgi:membrane protein YdbS with pleckstrin-like domain
MNKWLEIFVGLILVIVAVLAWALTLGLGFWDFGTAAWEFFKGGLLWLIIAIGALFILLGISDLKG